MRTIRVIHGNEEFILIDTHDGVEGRTVTVLVAPDKIVPAPGSPPSPEPRIITTDKGFRVPVARWNDNLIECLQGESKEREKIYQTVLHKYLEDHLQGHPDRGATFYYLTADDHFLSILSPSHPHGLAISLYTEKEPAETAQRQNVEDELCIKFTNNLCELLTRAAHEGYAGAVLNDSEPVYFCLDDDESLHFLRLAEDEDDEVEETLLKPNGEWSPNVAEKKLDLYANEDACDRNMVRILGHIPYYDEDAATRGVGEPRFYTVQDPADSDRVERFEMDNFESLSQSDDMMIVFQNQQSASEYIKHHAPGNFDIVPIDDLKQLIRRATDHNLVVVLEPGNHRAMSGVFWLNGNDVILDSFSGLWRMNVERGFDPLT